MRADSIYSIIRVHVNKSYIRIDIFKIVLRTSKFTNIVHKHNINMTTVRAQLILVTPMIRVEYTAKKLHQKTR